MKKILFILLCSLFGLGIKVHATDGDRITEIFNLIKENTHVGKEYLLELQAIYKQLYTENSPQYADFLMWCAWYCAEHDDLKQARRLMRRSCKLFRLYGDGVFSGRDTINEILRLDIKSKINYEGKRDWHALKFSERAFRLKKAFFPDNSDVLLYAALDLSKLSAERLKYKKSIYYHNYGFKAYSKLINDKFCSISESERELYWNEAVKYIYRTIDLANKAKGTKSHYNMSLAGAAYNALLLSKGLLLNTTINFENYVISSGNEKAIQALHRKKTLAQENVPLQVLDSLDYVILAALKERGQGYNIPQLANKWEDVRACLNDDDLAIEFYKTPTGDFGAILIRKEWLSPKIVHLKKFLKEGKHYVTLENALLQYSMGQIPVSRYDRLWALRSAVWTDEILKHFPQSNTGRVFFSADGELLISGIEYLPMKRPQFIQDELLSFKGLNDAYKIFRLSSTRELIPASQIAGKDAVIYGGLTYNLKDDSDNLENAKYIQSYKQSYVEKNRGAINLEFLPGTKIEADSVATTISTKSSSEIEVIEYTEDKGTEATLKALSGQRKRIIHIATHGFYDNMGLQESESWTADNNPMIHSGLYFSGATLAKSSNDMEDGILTAREISSLDLQGLDLLVLSACETAMGQVRRDGVFGLQRGFKMASANSILMSLWKVDDEATCLLMTEFYKNWIGNKMTKYDALMAAKQTVRSHKEKGWDDPKYWAAFVLLDALD